MIIGAVHDYECLEDRMSPHHLTPTSATNHGVLLRIVGIFVGIDEIVKSESIAT